MGTPQTRTFSEGVDLKAERDASSSNCFRAILQKEVRRAKKTQERGRRRGEKKKTARERAVRVSLGQADMRGVGQQQPL